MFRKINRIIKKIENNKILSFIYGAIKGVITLILIFILLVILVQKFSNNNFSLWGIRIYNVASGSMRPEYEIGDILITKRVEAKDIEVGDNITYLGKVGEIENLIITHKVQTIRSEGDNTYYITKGTANENYDPEVSYSQVYGKVIYKTRILSFISKMSTNVTIYIAIMIVGLIASVQISRLIFEDQLSGDDANEKK